MSTYRPGGIRPQLRALTDPATDERSILRRPLHNGELDAVMARTRKSPALIAHLLTAIGELSQFTYVDGGEDMLLALLDEPALRPQEVRAMAELGERLSLSVALLTAICVHPRTRPYTIIDAIWHCTTAAAAQVGAATGLVLVAATSWVRRQSAATGTPSAGSGYPSAAQYNAITATIARWDTWAGGDPARLSFLTTSSAAFTREVDLLAAGSALLAPPSATPAP